MGMGMRDWERGNERENGQGMRDKEREVEWAGG